MGAATTEIPISSIVYVQIGAEPLDEAHESASADNPRKTITALHEALYIEAGDLCLSTRIRLDDSTSAASALAKKIRLLMAQA